jgi:NAD+ kinase
MKTLAIYVDVKRQEARSLAAETATAAHELGYTVALCDNQNQQLHLADAGAEVEAADLLVTIGGDGTLLRGARIAYPFDIPLLGVNTGRLGFLTEIDGHQLNGHSVAPLRALLASPMEIEERVALEATLGESRRFIALNDIVVRKGSSSRIVPFGLKLDGEHVANIPADGIVVATPTGSTAYFLSAGGPIIGPGVEAFGVAALLPHTLFARPLIVSARSVIDITLDSELVHGNLEADCVRIGRAPKPVRFARAEPLKFFTRLESKLRWGVPLRGFR